MKKLEYWTIPPSRCKYAQHFDIEVGHSGIKGTKDGCICLLLKETERAYPKCDEKNCPPMTSLELLMYEKREGEKCTK